VHDHVPEPPERLDSLTKPIVEAIGTDGVMNPYQILCVNSPKSGKRGVFLLPARRPITRGSIKEEEWTYLGDPLLYEKLDTLLC